MIQNPKILLVCDDPVNHSAWLACLEIQRIQVAEAREPEAALAAWAEALPDLILIDLFDADHDGLALCAQLRQQTVIPILLLIPYYDEQLVLHGYGAGVDEVVVKPLSPAVFCAKVSAWLRRARLVPADSLPPVEEGGLCLDPERREAVLADGQRVRLSNLEFRLLLLLMSNPGKVFEGGELVQRVWGYAAGTDTVVLKNVMYRLRRKVEPEADPPRYLHTHGGQGYSFQP